MSIPTWDGTGYVPGMEVGFSGRPQPEPEPPEESDPDDNGGSEPEPPQEPPVAEDDGYNPDDYTVAEVTAYLDEHPDQAPFVLDRERAGKARTTLIGA